MSVINAFKEGKVPGTGDEKPNHITTAISNIFVFKDKAYKIYKSDSDFFNRNFNDLSEKDNRFSFTKKDFEWNNNLSPEIYLDLKGVMLNDSNVVDFMDSRPDAEELAIEMRTVDMDNQLIKKLVRGEISINDCYEIGKQFGGRALSLPDIPLREVTAYEDFLSRHQDIINWVQSTKESIPEEKVQKYIDFFKGSIEEHKEELDTEALMGIGIDIHSDNAIFVDDTFIPIDTYAPKKEWLSGYKFINIYRIATDLYLFLGKEAFEAAIGGYEEATGEALNRGYDTLMIMYCELIMWPYQYMLLSEKEPWRLDVAKKHEAFIEDIYRSAN